LIGIATARMARAVASASKGHHDLGLCSQIPWGNLLRDGIPSRRVMVTGNTVIDALLWTVKQRVPYGDPALDTADSTHAPVLLVTTHRRESWGSG
jgi:UDP-N-acetylglucosamine 2-epimerase (non-hydrolysing)